MTTSDQPKGLLERLAEGPVICAEGYLFELERRGYLQAGAFVPEAVLDHPDEVRQLHREFVHAGSDVVEAFTYYGHREKLRIIGKEHLLEDLNHQALKIAGGVAAESGTLLAGNICNTNLFEPGSNESLGQVRAMFEEERPSPLPLPPAHPHRSKFGERRMLGLARLGKRRKSALNGLQGPNLAAENVALS